MQPDRQRQRPSHPLPPGPLQQLLGVLVGAGLAYALTRHLAPLPSTLLTALLLAGASVLSGRHLTPWLWWGVLGASCGGLLGSAMVVGQKIQGTHPHEGLELRLGIVACLMVAGVIGGGSLSRDANHPDRRPPKDTLRSASALCTGIFAVVVTLTFLHSGLDQARTVSSRLSTALTILVMALTGPGWLVHLLGSSWWGKGGGGKC
ncbi:MAG: hypothetical protein ACK6BU_01020 [Cyanobacteriota bacterium]